VPARNTLFLSFALSWADQMGARALVIGANAIDYSGYPDCRPDYLSAFEKSPGWEPKPAQRCEEKFLSSLRSSNAAREILLN